MKAGKVLLLFLILMGSVILFGNRGILDNYRLDQKLLDIQKSNGELVVKNDALKKEILLLRNDMRDIEKVARDELGMVRRNDRVYRHVERSHSNSEDEKGTSHLLTLLTSSPLRGVSKTFTIPRKRPHAARSRDPRPIQEPPAYSFI